MEQKPTQPSAFRQTNAFAMNYALPFGALWIAGLMCFVHFLQLPVLQLVFMAIFVSTPVWGYVLLCRFRDRVCGGIISFTRGYLFSLLVYFYASLLLAAACYVWFQFFDHGAFIDGYLSMLDSPEVREAFKEQSVKQMTGGTGLDEMRGMLQQMQMASPVAYAANILDLNIFLGLVLSLPASLLAARRTAKNKLQ